MATRIPRAKAGAPSPESAAPEPVEPVVVPPAAATDSVKAVRSARTGTRAATLTASSGRASRTVRVRPDAEQATPADGADAEDLYAEPGTAPAAEAPEADYEDPSAEADDGYGDESVQTEDEAPRQAPQPSRPVAAVAAPPSTARRAGPPPHARPTQAGPRPGQTRPGGPRPPQAGPGGPRPGPRPVAPAPPASQVKDFPAGSVKEEPKVDKPTKEKKQRRSVQTVLTKGFRDVLNKVGTVAQLFGLVCALILVIYVLLVASDANSGNEIYRWFMHRSNNDLVYGFKTLFKLKTAKHSIEANYLTAAAVYLAAGAVIKRVLSRIAG